jgi:hypothetical protein
MKILICNRHLKGVGGSETYTYALAKELLRQGHQVEYFTLFKGITSAKIEKLGVQYASRANYDLILAGQIDTITEIKRLNFTGPIVQICHGSITTGEQPHQDADGYIAISEEVQKHLSRKGISAPVILNDIDCNRYFPKNELHDQLQVIVSMAQTNEAHEMIEAAAERIGARVIRLNKYKDKKWDVENEINKGDLVVSLGRGCYEAMACGRPVVIFDKRKYQPQLADGYLTEENFSKFIEKNCSGRWSNLTMSVDDLVNEFRKYDKADGAIMRRLAEQHLNVEVQARKILEHCQTIIDNFKYPGTIDLVYILGTGSKWGNNEIRFSIRSFIRYFRDLRNVVVVGELPEYIKGIIHIPCKDRVGVNKDARMMLKIMEACKDPRVSDNFIFCTDDTVLLSPLSFDDFTGWNDGPIMYDAENDLRDHSKTVHNPDLSTPSAWFHFVYETGRELQRRGFPDNNYDKAHSPQPINKAEFIEVLATWNMIDNHFTISNIYNNSTQIFSGTRISGKNLKVYGKTTAHELNRLAEGKFCMNYNDNSLNEEMKKFLILRFGEPSKYEIFVTDPRRRIAVQKWFEGGCNFDEGVAIFAHFAPKNHRLKRYFEIKKKEANTHKKLKNTLRLWLH